jgi:PAS domain S-box-containing protein
MDVKKTDGITDPLPPLRVLILEDNPRDAKLTASVLEGGGFRVQFEVMDSPEFFRESLEKAEYDVILADFNLRHWTAFDALDILKRSGKDIPLIVVTGSLGDEAAVECIKQGAADFVLKDRPARLPTTVQRALEEKRLRTENKRAGETAERLSHQVRSILEAAGEGIYGSDAEGLLTFVNPAATGILGYEAGELVGRSSHALWHHTRRDGTAYPVEDCRLHAALRTGSTTQGEDWFWRKDGSGLPVQLAAAPIKESGKVVGAVVTFNDITERKRAEEALAKRTRELMYSEEALKQKAQELSRSNAELQQFAYVASHDLQEPLRTMASFAQLLQRRYQGKLDASGDDFIHFIVDGAIRMQGLIHDLLAYSRVGSRGKDFVATDCTAVFDQAVANLQAAIAESAAVVTRDPLPTVPCDGEQLIHVFQNLIGNSIKFRDSPAPRVHVAAEKRPSDWVFSVKDNGIGIDPQYAKRIFEVFQRLHNRTEYPGSGIGLAIAKKIVERHGGCIWVESQPHQGATFLFTLPG